jgi:hypothetical protein
MVVGGLRGEVATMRGSGSSPILLLACFLFVSSFLIKVCAATTIADEGEVHCNPNWHCRCDIHSLASYCSRAKRKPVSSFFFFSFLLLRFETDSNF